MTEPLGAVILAAGAGARLGGVAKALLRRDGRTFLQRIVETARAGDAVVVVGPPHGDAVAAHARELGVRVAVNPAPQRGMASSVAIGFAAIGASAVPAAWLWPVDHPDVSAATLRALALALADHQVARPRYTGRGGHPPLVARALWPRLAACGDVPGGARAVLADADQIWVDVADAGVIADGDLPRDLEAG